MDNAARLVVREIPRFMEVLADAFPRIVPADKSVDVVLQPRGLLGCAPPSELEVSPCEVSCLSGNRDTIVLRPRLNSDGQLRFSHCFAGEQEHVIRVTHVSPSGERTAAAKIPFYSLEPDLYERTPFKGDLHIHSNRSDGQDPPAHVAAACRRIGLDFMALTDHWVMEPSHEAIEAFRDTPTDLRMFAGEEVHLPGINQHIVNFGGAFSINALARDGGERFERELAAVEAELPAALEAGIRHEYAGCLWAYKKIREACGMSVFCHPYWIAGDVDHTMEAIVEMHFSDMPCDAYELIGGFDQNEVESNIRQVARYHEARARGRTIPVVGASDAHSCERGILFGCYYTIVFAPSCSLDDLKESVRSLYSVAVEALPGQIPRAHGPYRLVRYAQFLAREFFPLHDGLCKQEGNWMFAHLAGDERALGRLEEMRGQTASLMERFCGVPPRRGP